VFRRFDINARPWRRVVTAVAAGTWLFAAGAVVCRPSAAEAIKIGVVRVASSGPIYIAQERGYFAAEGIPAELVYFDAGQPIAVATAAGSIDFGVTAVTGGLYSLAGQGVLRIIAGAGREFPGFHYFTYFISSRAYAAGLKSPKDFPGHAVALTQIGSPGHYSLGLLADKYKFDLKSIRMLPLQSIPNATSAVAGGQADAMVQTTVPAIAALLQSGDMRVLGWVGDETPWQVAAVFTATKSADQRADTVARFLRAYRKGVRDFHDALTGPDEIRQDGPTAPDIVAIIAKYTGLGSEDVKLGITYFDPEARLDVKDVLHQIAWYKAQGMVKPEVDGGAIIDKRYAIPLPER
jgi:NitT/TauT family transport system substrate-binding protein